MKRNWLVGVMICWMFMLFGQVHAGVLMKAESPQAVDGAIEDGIDFSVDIWIDNASATELIGGGASFHFYSPDGSLTDITHVNVGGFGPLQSIEYLNNLLAYFAFGIITTGNGWDGSLPDSMNYTLIGMTGMPSSLPYQEYIRMNLHVADGEAGILCIDSCTGPNPDWDWLFPPEYQPVTFDGPYCWTVGDYVENQAPEITCPDDEINPLGVGGVVARMVTASDPDGDALTITVENMTTDFAFTDHGNGMAEFTMTATCDDIGVNMVRFIASDGSLADTCYWSVTVVDDEDPVAICPGDITVNNDPGTCGAVVTFAIDATDNCPGVTAEADYTSGSVFPAGETIVTVTATDAALNTNVCTFTVTVNDTENPVAICPADIMVNNDPGTCGAVVAFAVDATDNCPGVTVDADYTSGSVFPVGETIVTVTATDAALNTNICTFTVTVNDTEDPIITCPEDITVDEGDPTDPENTGYATATDNCTAVEEISIAYSNSQAGNIIIRTWTATDIFGNSGECVQTITIGQPLPAQMVITPDTMFVIYAWMVEPMAGYVYVGDFPGYSVNGINQSTVVINGTIIPEAMEVLNEYAGFTDEVLKITFMVGDFIDGYMPLFDTTEQSYMVSGQFTDEEPFIVNSQVVMVGLLIGDVTGDNKIDILDILFIADYKYSNGPAPEYMELADVDCNGLIDIRDILLLISYVYKDGPGPDCLE